MKQWIGFAIIFAGADVYAELFRSGHWSILGAAILGGCIAIADNFMGDARHSPAGFHVADDLPAFEVLPISEATPGGPHLPNPRIRHEKMKRP